MTMIALMTALICILGPLTVPIGPVPVTFSVMMIVLSAYLLGAKAGTLSVLIYLLAGAAGLPVFSGFTGGIQKLLGPTGGYLIGFLFLSFCVGIGVDCFPKNLPMQIFLSVIGYAVVYSFGSVWLSVVLHMTLSQAFAVGVLPFVGLDIAKYIVTLLLGRAIRVRLKTAVPALGLA